MQTEWWTTPTNWHSVTSKRLAIVILSGVALLTFRKRQIIIDTLNGNCRGIINKAINRSESQPNSFNLFVIFTDGDIDDVDAAKEAYEIYSRVH